MKKMGLYIIIFILVVMLRENISFFYGNVLGVFKLDNNYEKGVIKLKDEEIKYLKKEIKDMRDFSNLQLVNYNYLISKVLYKESYNTTNYIIQYGLDNKVSIGSGVVNEFGMVGKITSVDKKTSQLTTLKELDSVSVLINNVIGKLYFDYDEEEFIVKDISNYDEIHINDEVYTSGYGTIKENLYIGKVKMIVNDVYSKKVYVESSVDFNSLNYLLIVGDF